MSEGRVYSILWQFWWVTWLQTIGYCLGCWFWSQTCINCTVFQAPTREILSTLRSHETWHAGKSFIYRPPFVRDFPACLMTPEGISNYIHQLSIGYPLYIIIYIYIYINITWKSHQKTLIHLFSKVNPKSYSTTRDFHIFPYNICPEILLGQGHHWRSADLPCRPWPRLVRVREWKTRVDQQRGTESTKEKSNSIFNSEEF